MHNPGWIFGAACLLAAAAVAVSSRRKARKTMDALDRMLTAAMDGSFRESTFDESRLSALETRFAHYLSASLVSARNVATEQEHIKTLIGDISHQTKTPISNLLLYTELLREEPLSPEALEYTDTLHAQAEKLRFLIDALVKLSRLESGILVLHPAPAPLSPILEQAAGQFASRAAEKGLTLTVRPTDVSACFDARWTSEALCNLVDNAVKYTDAGGVTLSVTPYEMFVRVDVADTGGGIPEAEQAKIFSRFYRSPGHDDREGVGIGLHLAREILRSEGGYIKVSSRVGEGSVFSLFLPASPEFFQNR